MHCVVDGGQLRSGEATNDIFLICQILLNLLPHIKDGTVPTTIKQYKT